MNENIAVDAIDSNFGGAQLNRYNQRSLFKPAAFGFAIVHCRYGQIQADPVPQMQIMLLFRHDKYAGSKYNGRQQPAQIHSCSRAFGHRTSTAC
ncbi:hypothetical protein D3C75_821730 [compost metagenome]